MVAALFFRLRGKVCKHFCLGKSDQEKNVGSHAPNVRNKQKKYSVHCSCSYSVFDSKSMQF